MDCSVIKLKHHNLSLISTTDFFYPLIDDPYLMGKIGCANVLSDLYAMGVTECDTLLMTLAASTDMPERERNIVTQELIRGFNDLAIEAGTSVTGGQTVMNPWPIIGGIATSICTPDEFILPEQLQVGDVVVLTKPIGTQVAVNVNQWYNRQNPTWERVAHLITLDEIKYALNMAISSMTRLNRNGARLMRKYGAHGATDVTGFGIVRHAANLAKNQKLPMNIELHTLPVIKKMYEIDQVVNIFKLALGFSAETSGGLLLCLPEEAAKLFIEEIEQVDKASAWIVGRVVENTSGEENGAYIVENVNVIDV